MRDAPSHLLMYARAPMYVTAIVNKHLYTKLADVKSMLYYIVSDEYDASQPASRPQSTQRISAHQQHEQQLEGVD